MDYLEPVDLALGRLGKLFPGGERAGEFGLPAAWRQLARRQHRRLGQRLVDGHPVHVPEPGAEHVFGLEIDLLVERDLVEIVAVALAARHPPGEADPLAELVGESELFGIGEMDLRKHQHAPVLETLANRLDDIVVAQVRLIDMDHAADVALDLFDADLAHLCSVPLHSPTRCMATAIDMVIGMPFCNSPFPSIFRL